MSSQRAGRLVQGAPSPFCTSPKSPGCVSQCPSFHPSQNHRDACPQPHVISAPPQITGMHVSVPISFLHLSKSLRCVSQPPSPFRNSLNHWDACPDPQLLSTPPQIAGMHVLVPISFPQFPKSPGCMSLSPCPFGTSPKSLGCMSRSPSPFHTSQNHQDPCPCPHVFSAPPKITEIHVPTPMSFRHLPKSPGCMFLSPCLFHASQNHQDACPHPHVL